MKLGHFVEYEAAVNPLASVAPKASNSKAVGELSANGFALSSDR
jgi:hypothetical protein